MSVKGRLLTSMGFALILTVVSEALILLVISSALRISLVLVFPLLFVFWLFQWLISPYLVGRGGIEIHSSDPEYGWLVQMVREVALASRISPPRVFLVDAPYPNAFAYGNSVSGKRVGITIPLLQILDVNELRAVIAHEVGHLKHRDVEIGMTLGLIPTALGYISTLLMNFGFFAILLAGDEFELLFALLALALGFILLVATLTLQVFVLWFNRLRESYADYNSYEVLGEGSSALATALAKIELYMQKIRLDPFTGIIVTAAPVRVESQEPLLVVREWLNKKVSVFTDILSTHPHPARRVQMLYRLIREGG
ncbi:Heat shock protein, Metallo peptidase, MEROPS family M48B [Metallosphaera sedula]|uniref:Protease HtpX homolog n=3 Tax=Metallosphaera TaxID=41980 RepID=A4YFH8_METS5|nr:MULTISPECIES: zinc metalloprotease HtpX [Metallosphaera]ABP95180.1 Heat shock protein, Metallo peptidase, MEROPS family M48B [Metallosphaera sedula DSM 5348]AIM27166.1 Heat shock protein, Metallo peptidase, MEROPS family M48B [Metallosphaera sedula]AKV74068.1 protease [Metallosphaera sedula]AKV76308.1 protease [Metallosphaera sedula]AKV78559.1 protease [Metallosphaera sedula]